MDQKETPVDIGLTHVESTDKIAAALAKAQGMIKPPLKNRQVDFTHNGQRTHYSYADLADVIAAVQKPLSDCGLAVTHRLQIDAVQCLMVTDLLHLSGQKLTTVYPLPNPGNLKPQAFGSLLTYARRYSLSCLVGIASEEDDDGQAAAGNIEAKGGVKPAANRKPLVTPKPATSDQQATKPPVQNHAEMLTKDQLQKLGDQFKESKWTVEQMKNFLGRTLNVTESSKIPPTGYKMVMNALTLTYDGAVAMFCEGIQS